MKEKKEIVDAMHLKERKFCPFCSNHQCREDDCELWLSCVYSTENIRQEGRCSIRFIAEKNSKGKLPV